MEHLAYFDNAATTFPKPECVYDYADGFYRNSGGNIGRGGNALAAEAGRIEREAKANLLRLYECPNKIVVFTASATDALNRAILGSNLGRGDVVCVTPFEHNAVTRTLQHLVDAKGIELAVMPFDPITMVPDLQGIKKLFNAVKPKMVVMTHASNVCGAVVPVEEISGLAKAACKATTIVDMSQTAGLLPLKLSEDNIDFAVFAGHKTLLAPFGVGGFICSQNAHLAPVIFGGNGIDSLAQEMPHDITDMVQVGSQNTYAIAGLKASTEWIMKQGMSSLLAKEAAATVKLLDILHEYDGIKVVGEEMRCARIGVVSCLFEDYSPDEVELLLGKFNVAVRSGIQCAPYAHKFLKTLPEGTVRFSISALMADQDFVILNKAINKLSNV